MIYIFVLFNSRVLYACRFRFYLDTSMMVHYRIAADMTISLRWVVSGLPSVLRLFSQWKFCNVISINVNPFTSQNTFAVVTSAPRGYTDCDCFIISWTAPSSINFQLSNFHHIFHKALKMHWYLSPFLEKLENRVLAVNEGHIFVCRSNSWYAYIDFKILTMRFLNRLEKAYYANNDG